jgi:Uma2 family endonuclease
MSDMLADYGLLEFTVDEFHRFAEAGIIDPGKRIELLDGHIVEMAPIGSRHWDRHGTIVPYLAQAFGNRAKVIGQGSFPLGLRSEPQPDIAVLVPRNYEDRTAASNEILAVIELADSSLGKDLGPKRALYARHGIADYLVVDLDGDRLFHHSEPHELGYGKVRTLGHGESFSLTALPDVALSSGPFLRPL